MYRIVTTSSRLRRRRHWAIGNVIAQGAYGVVREARDLRTGERVAVKILDRRRLSKLRGATDNLAREVDIGRMLRHRNILRVIDSFGLGSKLYIVLELV
ncbi:MAG: hypothetical protein MHM6MM_009310, partial [Cercozoa sp. M6MM]